MRRLIAASALALAALLPGVPAHAQLPYGPIANSWAPTRCWSQYPVNGSYFGSPGFGVWFRSVYAPTTPVTGNIYQFHRANGAECGYLGFPIMPEAHVAASGQVKAYTYQDFVRPGSCSLFVVVALDDGSNTTYSVTLANYFCAGG